MSNDLPIPDFLDIAPEVQKAATDAMAGGFYFDPPADAKVTTAKNGDVYKRWVEGCTVEKTWREGAAGGLVVAVLQLKVRTGFPHGGRKAFARHSLNFPLLMGQEVDENIRGKHEFMNNNSVNAITSLMKATGYQPTAGGLSGALLNMLFPVKDEPGANSPLWGKSVMVNFVDQPNKGEKAKTPRRTNVESYLPGA